MKYKIIIALAAIGIIAYTSWQFGWYIWQQQELWQYMTNIDYTTYMIIAEITQASVILAATAISNLKPRNQPATTPTTQPTQENKEIKELLKTVKQLKQEVSNINIASKLAPDTGGKKPNGKN